MTYWSARCGNASPTAAEKYNQPGKFTALIGFEWTSTPDGNNLHRNVIFRDGKAKADQVTPISQYDTQDPEELWEWMRGVEERAGAKLLAIPHNGNISSGLMFDDVTLTSKKPIDKDYAERRSRWEPIYEVTQMKGDGEAHPALSPNDEFADYETWDKGAFGVTVHTPDMLPREYAREALKRGLAYEAKLGVNPFKFGMIGSTDAHTSLATTTEDNFFGKIAPLEPSANPVRFEEIVTGRLAKDPSKRNLAWQTSASGLAAVWATDNTREALWDAMSRKEVYATTGSRLLVRVFAGFDFEPDDVHRHDFARHGYQKGVPMGGDLSAAPQGKAPHLLIRALRDVDGANLDRVQVVKGWMDSRRQTAGEGLRCCLVGRPADGQRRQAASRRQHGRRGHGHLQEHHRLAPLLLAQLAGPGIRPRTTCVLLCAGDRDTDAAAGPPMTRSSSGSNCRKAHRSQSRIAPTPRPSGIRRRVSLKSYGRA
jgi:hypothetical protein